MIAVKTCEPPMEAFVSLMKETDCFLNESARKNQKYFETLNPSEVETVVSDALKECSKDTPFRNKITLVSGGAFPDIVANKHYGVEVKSTNKNKWKSTGSSILESTRIKSVERIFLTFGKLGKPVSFKSRLYEECLSGISVTHYPRYQIDMELEAGKTIFNKMNTSYDDFRKLDNPVAPVSEYYKSLLQPGQSLWWAPSEICAPPILRLWNTLTQEEKEEYLIKGFVFFPEIFAKHSIKQYQRFVLWLATNESVIIPNIRDLFSAGGKAEIKIDGIYLRVSAIWGRVKSHINEIADAILDSEYEVLRASWNVSFISKNRINQWINLVSLNGATEEFDVKSIKTFLYNEFGVKNKLNNERISQRIRLPLFSLKAACGLFSDELFPESNGWVECENFHGEVNKCFVVQAAGDSMKPLIHNGDFCIFKHSEAQYGDIVLVQHVPYDNEYGGEYTIKTFTQPGVFTPINRQGYNPIIIPESTANEYKIIGVFCGKV